ncbi:MAG: hypothetical protein FWF90_18230 [Promicromonosporaceae bacterium]|nr:hypothetical protein [Promicromonosporaceae bacterium]
MANERLRAAIRTAGYSAHELAVAVGADPRAVERWIDLGVEPVPSLRREVALLLRRPEDELWPRRGSRLDPNGPYQPRAVGRAAATLVPGWLLTLGGLVLVWVGVAVQASFSASNDETGLSGDAVAAWLFGGVALVAGAGFLLVTTYRYVAQRDEEYTMAVDRHTRPST